MSIKIIIIEIAQNDGISVKERIIRFFMRKPGLTRREAEMIYDHSIQIGAKHGNVAFDASISITCSVLGLDHRELMNEIKIHSNQN